MLKQHILFLCSIFLGVQLFAASTVKLELEEYYYLQANGRMANDAISTFVEGENIYVPATTYLSNLGVEYKEIEKQIEGWVFNRGNTFSFSNYDTEGVTFIALDTLYINITKLNKSLGIETTINEEEGFIRIYAANQFGFERQFRNANVKETTLPYYKPDQLSEQSTLSAPQFSFETNLFKADEAQNINSTASMLADIGNHTVDIFFNQQKDKLNIPNLTISKTIREGRLSSYQIGDVTTGTDLSLSRNLRGRGVRVNNKDERQSSYHNSKTINGFHRPGYVVELYQNKVLIGQTQTDENGYYEFEDNPMFIGRNTFDLEFIGEFGDTERKTVTHNISGKLMEKGETAFSASFIDTTQSATGVEQSARGKVAHVEYTQGLLDNLSYTYGITANIENANNVGNNAVYLTNALHFTLGDTINNIELITNGNTSGIEIDSNGILYGTNYNISISEYEENFQFNNANTIEMKTANLSKNIKLTEDIPLNLFYGYRKQKSNGNSFSSSRAGFSTRYKNVNLRYAVENRNGMLQHTARLSGSIGKTRLTYRRIDSDIEERQSIELYRRIGETSLSARYEVDKRNEDTIFNINASRQFDNFAIRAYAQSSNNNNEIGINFSTNIYFDDGPVFTRQNLNGTGRVKANAFIDENYNNIRDENEVGISGLTFGDHHMWKDIESNENGIAILPAIQSERSTKIYVNEENIEDYSLHTPEVKHVQVHEGAEMEVLFPIHKKISLEFTLFKSNEEKILPFTLLTITSKEATFTAITDEDGYFFHEGLKPGTYTITAKDDSNYKTVIEIDKNQEYDNLYIADLRLKFISPMRKPGSKRAHTAWELKQIENPKY